MRWLQMREALEQLITNRLALIEDEVQWQQKRINESYEAIGRRQAEIEKLQQEHEALNDALEFIRCDG